MLVKSEYTNSARQDQANFTFVGDQEMPLETSIQITIYCAHYLVTQRYVYEKFHEKLVHSFLSLGKLILLCLLSLWRPYDTYRTIQLNIIYDADGRLGSMMP